MSNEQFIPNPAGQETNPNPISKSESQEFDAQGKPRSNRVMPDSSVLYLSDPEYTEALEQYHENKN